MQLIQTVAPIKQPISLDEAKLFSKIVEDDEDELILSFIKSATSYAEGYTNRQFEIATFELINECIWCDFRLPKSPTIEILKIEYMDNNGDYQILDTDKYYLYENYEISYIHFHHIPTHKKDKRAFKITFRSGYDVVPDVFKIYIKIATSTLYENRELYLTDFNSRKDLVLVPLAQSMLSLYRIQPI